LIGQSPNGSGKTLAYTAAFMHKLLNKPL